MSTKRSLKAFAKKHFPERLGGMKFYDKMLDTLTDASPFKAWKVFHEQFIDDVVNIYPKNKYVGLPYLNPVDCPCAPGSVILLREKPLQDMLLRRPYQACIAGTLGDFCPHERTDTLDNVTTDTSIPAIAGMRPFFKAYQARSSERAVIVHLVLQERRSLLNFDKDTSYIDLDNFDSTGYDPDRCYVINNVLYATSLTIEVTLDGDNFYEHTYGASTPFCYRATKVRIEEEGHGKIESIKEKDKKLPIKLLRRRGYQNFFNAFIPNQTRLNNTAGDCPPVLDWEDPLPIRTRRPQFLPRPDRPCYNILEQFPQDLDLIHHVNTRRGNGKKTDADREPERGHDRQLEEQELD